MSWKTRRRKLALQLAVIWVVCSLLSPMDNDRMALADEMTSTAEQTANAPESSMPTAAPAPTKVADPTSVPATNSPAPTKPSQTEPALPASPTPKSSPSPEASLSPEVSPSPEISPSPEVTSSPEVSTSPEVSPTPETSSSPETSPSPEVSSSPEASPSPEVSSSPEVSPSPEISPSPTPEIQEFELLKRSNSHKNNYLNAGLLSLPKDGMPIPLLYQFNYTTPVCKFDGESKSVASSGCGATAASMVIAYICKDYNQTPYTLFYEAAAHGRYRGGGLDYATIQDMLTSRGIDARMSNVGAEVLRNALENNQPIIINMGAGTFTNDGHYILLRGLNSEGRVLVNDPNSSDRSASSYPVEQIVREAKSRKMLVIYSHPQEDVASDAKVATTPTPSVEALEPEPSYVASQTNIDQTNLGSVPASSTDEAEQIQTDAAELQDNSHMPIAVDIPKDTFGAREEMQMPIAVDIPRH